MSRSQFQSKIFILRHAWLNLWDERMTTGRINQVATMFSPWQKSLATHCSRDQLHLRSPIPVATLVKKSLQWRSPISVPSQQLKPAVKIPVQTSASTKKHDILSLGDSYIHWWNGVLSSRTHMWFCFACKLAPKRIDRETASAPKHWQKSRSQTLGQPRPLIRGTLCNTKTSFTRQWNSIYICGNRSSKSTSSIRDIKALAHLVLGMIVEQPTSLIETQTQAHPLTGPGQPGKMLEKSGWCCQWTWSPLQEWGLSQYTSTTPILWKSQMDLNNQWLITLGCLFSQRTNSQFYIFKAADPFSIKFDCDQRFFGCSLCWNLPGSFLINAPLNSHF